MEIENVLISSFFEENSIARNKFAHLISVLQQESEGEQGGDYSNTGDSEFENPKMGMDTEVVF